MGAGEEAPLLLHHGQAGSGCKRTGTVWTAVAHLITALIGSGVLSLAWSIAQLGWVAGPLTILLFASIYLFSAFLLCNCSRSPDPQRAPLRHASYLDAVGFTLGQRKAWLCGLLVKISLYGIGVAYTFTTATSMEAINKSNCYHKQGHEAACEYGGTSYMLIFGFVQVLLSQIPNFHDIQWLSVVAAAMSFTYSFIGFGLGSAQVIANGSVKGSISGAPASNGVHKAMNMFEAIGDIAFAYPVAVILFEVQDTLKSPPSESETMKSASAISIIVTTFFYLLCGCVGYAAFGEDAPGNLLTGFGFYEPYWLIDFANVCIMVHLLGSYQVYTQPMFAAAERWIKEKYPNSRFMDKTLRMKLPLVGGIELNSLRMCFRTTYVMSTTAIAIGFPYFNQVLGLIGALNFWPLSIYFPVSMYLRQGNVQPWTIKWIAVWTFSILCLLVTAFALIGSFEGIISARFGPKEHND